MDVPLFVQLLFILQLLLILNASESFALPIPQLKRSALSLSYYSTSKIAASSSSIIYSPYKTYPCPMITRRKATNIMMKTNTDENEDSDAENTIKKDKTNKKRSLADQLLDFPFEPELYTILQNAQATRLVKDRSYARRDSFEASNINARPTLDDLCFPNVVTSDTSKFWISGTYRLGVITASYLAFDPLVRFFEKNLVVTPQFVSELIDRFAPGISILYGTFISLTLSILYERLKNIQSSVSEETSVLSLMTQNILAIFENDEQRLIRGTQCIADQIRILVKESRGRELMALIYSDPYLRMMELIKEKEGEYSTKQMKDDLGAKSVLLGSSRGAIQELMALRARRLSQEALALPPTHFLILSLLTFLILLGFTLSCVPTVTTSPGGILPNESSILFSLLVTVYVIFFNFANDLNNPFSGVYNIRRSSTASHLLQSKWLIVNHPLLKGKVSFDDVTGDIRDIMERDDLMVWTPGLGPMSVSDSDTSSE